MNIVESVEAVLFVSESPVSLEQLAHAIQSPVYVVEAALETLGARLQFNSALQLVRIAGGYQFCTKPEFAEIVSRHLQPSRQKLSKSLLETLAVIAYQQPLTSAEIEAIRGVQSDYTLRQLMDKRLIREVGKKPTPGRPILYGTTQQFLHAFNLNDLSDLPALDPNISKLHAVSGAGFEEQPPLL